MMFAVDDDLRAQGTASEAAAVFQTVFHVRVGLPDIHADQILDRVEEFACPTHPAGGAHADMHFMAALGDHAEGLVKGRHLKDPIERNLELLADFFEHFPRQPVVDMLNLHENMDQRAGFSLMGVDDLIDVGGLHGLVRMVEGC
ncbi:hypothetical protein DESC_100027 [Desulfosarcina cetonica]|nr:hypothetical protein DESC_100027 [Desulfosarcina cetonica]